MELCCGDIKKYYLEKNKFNNIKDIIITDVDNNIINDESILRDNVQFIVVMTFYINISPLMDPYIKYLDDNVSSSCSDYTSDDEIYYYSDTIRDLII